MTSSRSSAMSSQKRSSGSSSKSGVCKGWKAPFRRCYCGEEAPCAVSWSEKNPGRRYWGCRYWPDPKEDCGYYEFYDDEVSDWYKQVLNELKPKHELKPKKQGAGKLKEASLVVLVKVLIVLVLFLAILVGFVLWMVLKG